MSHYHIDDPDSYYECYKEEIEHMTKMMVTLDHALVHANLPLVSKTKELFDMVDDTLYKVEKRYKKKNKIDEDDDDSFTYFRKDDLLDSMRTVLQEEVTRYFDQLSGNAK